jgi:hypothetical protein
MVRRVSLQTVQTVKEELNLLDCFFNSKKIGKRKRSIIKYNLLTILTSSYSLN